MGMQLTPVAAAAIPKRETMCTIPAPFLRPPQMGTERGPELDSISPGRLPVAQPHLFCRDTDTCSSQSCDNVLLVRRGQTCVGVHVTPTNVKAGRYTANEISSMP